MKQAQSIGGFVLLFLYALLPIGTLIASVFGYTLILTQPALGAIVTVLCSVAAVLVSWWKKENCPSKAARLCYAVCAPLAAANWIFYLFQSGTATVVVCILISLVCAIMLIVRYAAPFALKLASGVLTALMILPLALFSFFALMFGDFGKDTVVRTVPSPNGGYYAEVIDSDQGALGGDTVVNVYDGRKVDALIFTAAKSPQRVYVGDWGEHKSMTICWQNEHTLVINGECYTIE